MNITQIPTPDFTPGRGGKTLQYIVMHWGVVTNLQQIDNEVANPNRQMSYTYALDKDVVHQYVKEEDTAWHAGVFDINQRSIGICIAAGPNYPYADQDYETAAKLIANIFQRRGVLEIKAHRDFKPTECPGNLDFGRLRARVNEILNPAPTPPPTPDPVPPTPPAPPAPVSSNSPSESASPSASPSTSPSESSSASTSPSPSPEIPPNANWFIELLIKVWNWIQFGS